MVEVARRLGSELGATNVEFRVLDAQALDLPDASVDAVVCRWGYMLMPHPAAALRETRRVLRPGGRLAFSVWGASDRNPWAAIVARALIEAGHMDRPGATTPGIFALSDPAWIESLVVEAGFEPPVVSEIAMRWPFDSFDDYWGFTLDAAGALSMVIERLPADEQEAVKRSVREALGQSATGAFELEGLCLNASTRPADALGV
jgi:SAM-dependent methyltransferase